LLVEKEEGGREGRRGALKKDNEKCGMRRYQNILATI
jgi:hypothetical protein